MSRIRLSPEQRAAITHGEGPLLVLAGAGTGKTEVLAARAAHLIERGLDPRQLLAVTFTNNAAGAMRERIERLLGQSSRGLRVRTFHSFGAGLLSREAGHATPPQSFSILGPKDAQWTLEEVMKSLDYNPQQWDLGTIMRCISDLKKTLVHHADLKPKDYRNCHEILARVYPAYQRALRCRNAYDFDDLVVRAVSLLEDHDAVRREPRGGFRHVLIDEFQNTDIAQYRLIRALTRNHRNVFAVGNDDHAIYRFRGADGYNLLRRLVRDFAGIKVVRLERNYRSTKSIVRVANSVIGNNEERYAKKLRSVRGVGSPVRAVHCQDEEEEAERVADAIKRSAGRNGWSDFAILYRQGEQRGPLIQALRARKIPYRVVNADLVLSQVVADVLAYLSVLANPRNDIAFRRTMEWPSRRVSRPALRRLAQLATRTEVPLLAIASWSPSQMPSRLTSGGSGTRISCWRRSARMVRSRRRPARSWVTLFGRCGRCGSHCQG